MKHNYKKYLLIIVIGLSLAGLLSIGPTHAFFSDGVDSGSNIFTAGILDLTLISGQSNFVSNAENMQPGNQVNRDIYIGKTSISSSLQYKVSYEPIGGNEDFCNQLQLKIWYDHYHGLVSEGYDNRDMRLKYDEPLTSLVDLIDEDFIIPHPDDQFDTDPNDGTEQWFFYSIILPSTIAETYQGQVCNFNFVVEVWQDNIGNYGDGGFTDVEKLENTIKAGYWNPPVVLNEFLPNAVNYPEFIEIYNNTNSSIDLNGFYIKANGDTIPINMNTTSQYSESSTVIIPNSWLVITTAGDQMDNNSGTITLFNSNDIMVDSYIYGNPDSDVDNTPGSANSLSSDPVPVDKSYARIPDGFPNWVDPIPTPGAPNKLEEELDEEEIEELQLEEIIEEIPLITATTTTSTIPDTDILENSTSTSTIILDQTTTTTTTPDLEDTATTTTITIPEQTTTTATIPEATTTTTTSTIPEIPEELITTTTTTEPLIEEGPTTTTTIESPAEETTTMTTTISQEPITTTTTEPPVEEFPITTTTTTIEPPVSTTTTTIPEEPITPTTTTTITTPEPPVSTDTEIDDSTAINLINIYFV